MAALALALAPALARALSLALAPGRCPLREFRIVLIGSRENLRVS